MSDPHTQFGQDYSRFDSKSTEELNRILRQDIQQQEGEFGPDAILHILEVLQRNPGDASPEKQPDVDAAWQDFLKYYYPEESEEPKPSVDLLPTEPAMLKKQKKCVLTHLGSITAVLAVIVPASIAASATGYQLAGPGNPYRKNGGGDSRKVVAATV